MAMPSPQHDHVTALNPSVVSYPFSDHPCESLRKLGKISEQHRRFFGSLKDNLVDNFFPTGVSTKEFDLVRNTVHEFRRTDRKALTDPLISRFLLDAAATYLVYGDAELERKKKEGRDHPSFPTRPEREAAAFRLAKEIPFSVHEGRFSHGCFIGPFMTGNGGSEAASFIAAMDQQYLLDHWLFQKEEPHSLGYQPSRRLSHLLRGTDGDAILADVCLQKIHADKEGFVVFFEDSVTYDGGINAFAHRFGGAFMAKHLAREASLIPELIVPYRYDNPDAVIINPDTTLRWFQTKAHQRGETFHKACVEAMLHASVMIEYFRSDKQWSEIVRIASDAVGKDH